MVEKSKIITEEVKYSGYGNFKDAYKYAYDWLKDNEGYNVVEEKYTEKISGNAKEVEFKWKCDKKLNDYFKSAVTIDWKVLGMTDVEVEVDGRKEKMNKFAELKVKISGTLEKDYENKWEATPFYKFLREIYDKYVIPKRSDDMSGAVEKLVREFKEEMKAFFDLTGKR